MIRQFVYTVYKYLNVYARVLYIHTYIDQYQHKYTKPNTLMFM